MSISIEQEQMLQKAMEYCNDEDKSTEFMLEFMLEFMQSVAKVDLDTVLKFLLADDYQE